MKSKPTVLISSCLLGENVRYNKGHCSNSWIVNELSKHVNFIPVCPEMSMGLGTPREEIHLYYTEASKKEIRLKTKYTNIDLTDKANETYQKILKELAPESIDGIILTKRSPSCASSAITAINIDKENEVQYTQGLFAQFLRNNFDGIPIIDSGRIKDTKLRENFVKSLFAHFRLSQIESKTTSIQNFHQKYKYLLMEHSPGALKELGRIASNSDKENNQLVLDRYKKKFLKTIGTLPTKNRRHNALMHVLGYLKKDLSSVEKKEIIELFNDFKDDVTNYLSIQRFLHFLTVKYEKQYLITQYIFDPYPKDLKIMKEI